MNIKKIINWVVALGGTLFLVYYLAMPAAAEVPDEYVITEQQLTTLVADQPNSFVFFFTDWCPWSKKRMAEQMIPLDSVIKEQELPYKVIFIASDVQVPLAQVKEQRAKGMEVYYLKRPGSNGFVNRWAIKDFVDSWLPDNNFQPIQQFQFAIPVLMYVNNQMEIIDPEQNSVAGSKVHQLLKQHGVIE